MNKRRNDALELINIISKTKNTDQEVIVSFLLNSIKRIIHSQLDPDAEITLEVIDNQLILTNHNKLVVSDNEEYKDDSQVVDIHLSEAQKIDPNIKEGDRISSLISFDDFSRSFYSKIENSFKHEILTWEKKRVYEKYQPLIGQVVEAKLEDELGNKGATFILEDGTLCFMPSKYRNKQIDLLEKKIYNVTIEEVYENSKNFQVLVSNDSPNQVREILKNEVPEIANGDIQIVAISRVQGERSKISFRQNPNFNGQIDVIGSVVGPNGSRINRVCDLFGEKIDVILYSDNIIDYITNALSPAKIVSINKKTSGNGYLVVVPDKHNTLAIGKKGINVKLTVELIRVNIDICSYTYAIENNIQINWNGNLTKEELDKIEQGPVYSEDNNLIKNNRRTFNNRSSRSNGFFVDINEFEKEIEEYNSEISSYEPIDYSAFNFSTNTKSIEELGNTNIDDFENDILLEEKEIVNEKENKNYVNKKEINKINQNFKFDKDLAGDFDIDDYDFSGFDDEDSF